MMFGVQFLKICIIIALVVLVDVDEVVYYY